MNRLKNILTILFFSLTLTSCGQTQTTDTKSEGYKVLAKLISFEGGDKIHFAKFRILKNLSDSLALNDTIIVGYYNYKQPEENIDNVLLTLKKYDGQTSMKNYFICPNYDGKTNIQKAKIEYIDFDYWEGCETGKGECNPLTFSRTEKENNWFLIWNMVVKGVSYINPEGYLFLDQKRKLGIVKRIRKQIDKFNLTNEDIGIATN
ncbi:MAG TPA: hypothetical protein VFN30_11475 [Chitinophagaceae bacterium]|nr:hypothetical protein [Chitinophagaceae bacterium]